MARTRQSVAAVRRRAAGHSRPKSLVQDFRDCVRLNAVEYNWMSAPEHGKHNCHSIRAPDLTVFWVAHATGAASLSTVHAICAPLFAAHRGGSVAVTEIVAGLFAWVRARDASIATLECGPDANLRRIAFRRICALARSGKAAPST